jgi:hypothetical protein
MSKSEDIQKEIEKHHAKIADIIDRFAASGLTTPGVLAEHAKILDLTSQLAEISTHRIEHLTKNLIRLTYVLVALTAALLILTIALVVRR